MDVYPERLRALAELAWPLVALAALMVLAAPRNSRAIGASLQGILGRGIKVGAFGAHVEIPPAIASGSVQAATAEGEAGPRNEASQAVVERLRDKSDYEGTLGHYPYLLHTAEQVRARTAPGEGRWTARLWLEFDTRYGFPPDRVRAVYWRLDPSFRESQRTIVTAAREAQFEVWLSLYGEFTAVCVVELDDGATVWLTRYVDLPGRPSD